MKFKPQGLSYSIMNLHERIEMRGIIKEINRFRGYGFKITTGYRTKSEQKDLEKRMGVKPRHNRYINIR